MHASKHGMHRGKDGDFSDDIEARRVVCKCVRGQCQRYGGSAAPQSATMALDSRTKGSNSGEVEAEHRPIHAETC